MVVESLKKIKDLRDGRELIHKDYEIGEVETGRKFSVYFVPIEFLTLNPRNSRFQTELNLNFLNDENSFLYYQKEKQKEIEKWILNQNPDRNLKTEKDIIEKGQQVPGLITADGLIINGNRRFTLIKKIYAQTQDYRFSRFKTVILDDYLSKEYQKIKKLEIKVQFGKDESLGYKRINTMLAIRDFQNVTGWKSERIKDYFKWDVMTITDLNLTLNFIDDYLKFFGLKGYHFIDGAELFFKYLVKNHDQIQNFQKIKTDWSPKKSDFYDYKYTCFKILRSILRSKINFIKFQTITKIINGINIFSKKEIWEDCKKQIEEIYIKGLEATKNWKRQIEKENPDRKVLATEFEKNFKLKTKIGIEKFLLSTEYEIKQLSEKNKPEKIIKDIKKNIEKIDEIICDGKPIKESIKKDLRKTCQTFIDVVKKID